MVAPLRPTSPPTLPALPVPVTLADESESWLVPSLTSPTSPPPADVPVTHPPPETHEPAAAVPARRAARVDVVRELEAAAEEALHALQPVDVGEQIGRGGRAVAAERAQEAAAVEDEIARREARQGRRHLAPGAALQR